MAANGEKEQRRATPLSTLTICWGRVGFDWTFQSSQEVGGQQALSPADRMELDNLPWKQATELRMSALSGTGCVV